MTVAADDVPPDFRRRLERWLGALLREERITRPSAVGRMAAELGVHSTTVVRWLAGFAPEPRAFAAAEAVLRKIEKSPRGGSRT